ncbi:cell division control protein [Gigaspora margarita]|uniref:Cell division control protein n=1 Tax=Gigaspora margarita TaxID=4874 RepID=A0A8H4ERY9_GIGMA|nr:cell division control protein [Gigaspora margarita]
MKFQYLEEDRIEFLKKVLWNYANLISSICVVDDESCERIRVCLESCDVDKDIQTFIKERATGPDIPEPPSYVNFYAGSGENGTRY